MGTGLIVIDSHLKSETGRDMTLLQFSVSSSKETVTPLNLLLTHP